MWRMKLELDSSKQILGSLAIKHQVSMTGYPLSYYKDKKWLYLVAAGFFFGEEKNKKALLKEISKSKDFVHHEIEGDFGIFVLKQPLFSEPAYNPEIIRPTPVIINKTGFHIWDLASFNRKALENVLGFAEEYFGAKILKFRKEKIANISFTRLLPELTKNQERAMETAINQGYYDYPKKIKMEKLAKIQGISYSTFQAHLKKAESKILPSIYKEL